MKILTNKLLNDQSMSVPADTSMNSMNSIDLDYDLWEGQFQISNNNNSPFSEGINNIDTHNNKINSVLHGDLRSRLTTAGSRLPITHQILDSEDVFLSLHPSDFESLAIANANAGANSFLVIENNNNRNNIIDDGNRIMNSNGSSAFPKSIHTQKEQKIVKGKELNGSNGSEFVKVYNETATELLQNRLSEQVIYNDKNEVILINLNNDENRVNLCCNTLIVIRNGYKNHSRL